MCSSQASQIDCGKVGNFPPRVNCAPSFRGVIDGTGEWTKKIRPLLRNRVLHADAATRDQSNNLTLLHFWASGVKSAPASRIRRAKSAFSDGRCSPPAGQRPVSRCPGSSAAWRIDDQCPVSGAQEPVHAAGAGQRRRGPRATGPALDPRLARAAPTSSRIAGHMPRVTGPGRTAAADRPQ
jgi:hypothetical protein